MTKPDNYVPKLCRHKARDLAFVRLSGRAIYLGRWGSPEAKANYDRHIADWLAGGRAPAAKPVRADQFLVEDLVADWVAYLNRRLVGSRQPREIGYALRTLLDLHAKTPAIEFRVQDLHNLREHMIRANLCRSMVNRRIGFILRLFRWGVKERKLPVATSHELSAIERLRPGEFGVRESEPVEPVDRKDVDAILPFVSRQVRAMIEIQWLTGMRPGEVLAMRKADIHPVDDVSCYRVVQHKTRHLGRKREVPILPAVETILAPFLLRTTDAYLFSPREAEAERRIEMARIRVSKVQPSQRARHDRALREQKQNLHDHYTVESYGRAIARACEKAGISRWSPNQLRHAAATRIANTLDLLAASYVLGHSSTTTTQIYAKMDFKRAKEVMQRLG
jgi:integrase